MSCPVEICLQWRATFIHGDVSEGEEQHRRRASSLPALRKNSEGCFEAEQTYVQSLWAKAEQSRKDRFGNPVGKQVCSQESSDVELENSACSPIWESGESARWADCVEDEHPGPSILDFSDTSTRDDELDSGANSSTEALSPMMSLTVESLPSSSKQVPLPEAGERETGFANFSRRNRGYSDSPTRRHRGDIDNKYHAVVADGGTYPNQRTRGGKWDRNNNNRRSQSYRTEYQAEQTIVSDGPITTLMIRHIPCCIRQNELRTAIERLGFTGKFDFLYLPILEDGSSNLGYGFINFRTEEDATGFSRAFTGYRFEHTRSVKVCEVKPARLQGFEANAAQFGTTTFNKGRGSPLYL